MRATSMSFGRLRLVATGGRSALAYAAAVVVVAGCGSGDSNDVGTGPPPARPKAAPTAARANLIVVDNQPLRVRGTGFRPREQVRVAAAIEARTWAVTARANRRGAFTAALGLNLGRCQAVVLKAVGSLGTRALNDLPAPACAAP